MSENIPEGIEKEHVLKAIQALDDGVSHKFADSTKYDLVIGHDLSIGDGRVRRYPPKAVLGLSAQFADKGGRIYDPYDFKGGESSKCFRILRKLGFKIVLKPGEVEKETIEYPDEADGVEHYEGACKSVVVNRYERDQKAKAKCVKHFGAVCQVCRLNFVDKYGKAPRCFKWVA
ncbi:hypothetical protein M3027_20705 [Geoalkalibacter halelectricus]|nr:hypothetical protein [Geoalkalibacter halelectricus]